MKNESVHEQVVLPRPASRTAHGTAGAALSPTTDLAIVAVLAALAVASWLPRMHGPLDLRWDGATYYVLGTALAEGKGYRLLNEPGEIEAVQYPPLLPAIIAAHQLALGTNDPVIVGRRLRLSFFLMYLAYILGGYALARQFLPPPYAFGASLVVLLNLFTNFLSDLCFADIPFALVTTVFVWLARKPGRLHAGIAALLAVAAYLLRTVGIALLAAWTCEALFARQYRKAAIRAVLSLVPIVAWHGYIHSVESSPSYTHPAYAYQRADYLFYNVSYSRNVSLRDPFTPELGTLSREELSRRFVQHLAQMPLSLGESLSAKLWYWRKHVGAMIERIRSVPGVWRLQAYAPDIVLFLLDILIVVGLFLLLREGEVLVPVYLGFVLIALCLTPWSVQWPRYWAPAVPFLAVALFRTVLAVNSRTRQASGPFSTMVRFALAVLVGLTVLFQVLTLYTVYAEQMGEARYLDRNGRPVTARLFFYEKDGYRELDAGLDWLMGHARSDDIVAASMPHWVYVRTGLKSVMPPFERDPDTMQALLDSVPVTYVVVDTSPINFTRQYTLPLLRAAPDRWAPVYTVSGAEGEPLEIYRRIGRESTKATAGADGERRR